MLRNFFVAFMLGVAVVAPGSVSTRLESKAQAAQVSGAKYFNTLAQARSFARSIASQYHTSITKPGKLYRVDYWKKGSH